MLEYLFNPLKFIPNEYETTIYDIDFKRLYDEGKRLIISDLDNTLISYREKMPTKELLDFKQKLNEMGFEIVICSNNHKKRVKSFCEAFGVPCVWSAHKPFVGGLRKALKKARKTYGINYSKDMVVEIGDQLLTDQFASTRYKLYTIMVRNLDPKTEIWTTRFNRRLENKILKRIKRKYPDLYEEKLSRYVGEKIAR
jgi:HAD superfamily phosphatase (TIGR01668 family)